MSREIVAAIKTIAEGLAEYARQQEQIVSQIEAMLGRRAGEPTVSAGVAAMAHQHDRVGRVDAEAGQAPAKLYGPRRVDGDWTEFDPKRVERIDRRHWVDGQWVEFDPSEVRYGEHKAAKTGPVSEAITVVGALRAGSVDHKAINEAHVERDLAGPWLDTNGITRPCRGGDVVRVRFRNGSTAEGLAEDFSWLHGALQPDDIVGWQLLREKAAS